MFLLDKMIVAWLFCDFDVIVAILMMSDEGDTCWSYFALECTNWRGR